LSQGHIAVALSLNVSPKFVIAIWLAMTGAHDRDHDRVRFPASRMLPLWVSPQRRKSQATHCHAKRRACSISLHH
jgi:hypothetical protein